MFVTFVLSCQKFHENEISCVIGELVQTKHKMH